MDTETNSPKNRRVINQDVLDSLEFDVLEIYGHAVDDADIPSLLTVHLYPGSFERLLRARRAVRDGVSLAGMNIRKVDISTDVAGDQWSSVYVMLIAHPRPGYYSLKVHCCSHENGIFLTAYQEISEDWFKSVYGKFQNLT